MKEGNAGNIPALVNGANGVEFAGANIPVNVGEAVQARTITVNPGNTVTFSQGIAEPVVITDGHGIVLNLQGALAPSIVTSFDDNIDISPLGDVVREES